MKRKIKREIRKNKDIKGGGNDECSYRVGRNERPEEGALMGSSDGRYLKGKALHRQNLTYSLFFFLSFFLHTHEADKEQENVSLLANIVNDYWCYVLVGN